MGTSNFRTAIGGALLALVAGGLGVAPAGADRDDPPTGDRGILEHQVPVDMTVRGKVFYPVRDDYKDYISVRVFESPETDEWMRSIDYQIIAADGDVVLEERGSPYHLALYGRDGFGWDGRDENYDLQAEGIYTITVTVVDGSGDTKVMTKEIRLDRAHWRHRTWSRTFRAAATVINKDLGRCGGLRRPARSAWPGSLGYRSTRCARRGESYAATVNGIYLPRDPDWDWGSIRLDIYGGSAGGRYRGSQAGYAYLTNEGKWLSGMTVGPRVRRHKGLTQYERHILGVDDGEPHFIWSAGTGGGQGYDIKSFTVVADYSVFE